jgi:hypothetical protein
VLILLPPSETKRPGGSGVPLLIDDLAFAGLAPQREAAVGALEELAKDPGEMARVLKLSARQIGEVDVNAGVRSSPTMPARSTRFPPSGSRPASGCRGSRP